MAPMEVFAVVKAKAESRRRDVIERSWTAGMFSGLAFAGKLKGMNTYLPGAAQASGGEDVM